MGDVNVRKVWSMNDSINWASNIKPEEEYAVYEIKKDGKLCRVRYSDFRFNTTDLEKEVNNIVDKGYDNWDVGFNVDPYKAAEKMLAEHYGYAKMIEAHYKWEGGVIY